MHIRKLHVRNYRGIQDLTLDFEQGSNIQVLIGINGTGKSALLECMAIMLSTFTARVCGNYKKARAFNVDDISNAQDLMLTSIEVEHSGAPLGWCIAKKRKGVGRGEFSSDLERLNEETRRLSEQLKAGDAVDLPLAVFYNVRRAVVETPMRMRAVQEYGPEAAYDKALDNTSSEFDGFFRWFRRQEDLENERIRDDAGFRDPLLEAVRQAITDFMTGFGNLRIRRSPLRMTVEKDGHELSIKQLSDGEKCLLALVGDLARRLAIANPVQPDKLKGDGVVIIDEIDLHLHPRWQRMVVEQLSKTFENCQFILSTHSPQLLGHIQPESVWVLGRNEQGQAYAAHPDMTYGMDSNRILELVMESTDRKPEIKKALKELFRLIDSDLDKAKKHLARLSDKLEKHGSHPELVRAQALLTRLEMLRK